jgi:DedD protein
MAQAIGDDELQLKKQARRRLVGAIALVLVVVIFLPMFLADEPKPVRKDIDINIPPPVSEDAPPPAGAQDADTSAATAPLPPPETSVAPPREVTGMPNPVAGPPPVVESEKTTQKNSAAPRPADAGKKDEFMVQLGAFSNAANAAALRKKLIDSKFKAHTEVIKTPGGERTRVRVGPYASREAADKARERLVALKLVVGGASVVRRGE